MRNSIHNRTAKRSSLSKENCVFSLSMRLVPVGQLRTVAAEQGDDHEHDAQRDVRLIV